MSILKDSCVENLETTPNTFLSNFFSKFYLSQIINYLGSIFTLHLTRETFSLVCVLSVMFFLSFFFPFFLFLSVFSLTDNNDFLVFLFHLVTNIHLFHRDFDHSFLIDLFLITRLIAAESFAFYLYFIC